MRLRPSVRRPGGTRTGQRPLANAVSNPSTESSPLGQLAALSGRLYYSPTSGLRQIGLDETLLGIQVVVA